ncbi:MAG: cation-translocating P-type ATPase [Alphaproteobacteria bacterium]|nr:cation-translocating P-type ATPase [Alphaproteobacteria bacterium]MCB9794771.1 cation-translocating P-type ATPase [Alphaproteobacteria bacterium]
MQDPLTPAEGLSAEQAAARLERDGPNEVAQAAPPSPWATLLEQLKNPMVAMLLVAAAVAGALGEHADAVAIGVIVVLNAGVGAAQELRAERALAALRSLTSPRARVLRGGHSVMVPGREVVVGDRLLLEAGDVVAADARVLRAHHFSAVESALTGESLPVAKSPEPVDEQAPLAERSDRVFSGTTIATGTAEAEVLATGMQTELGRIATLLASAESGPTPLQLRLAQVSKQLLWLCLGVVAAVALLEWRRGAGALDVLLASVSLAVAAVPEGLPAVVTIALAMGVQRMATRHALIRRLPAVETLGCVTVICTDKTGTLTTGEMRVRDLWGQDRGALLDTAVACCDAELGEGEAGVGDPTELALLLAGRARGLEREAVERDRPRVSVHPFDAERKRMSVLRADGRLYLKGALGTVAPLCVAGLTGAPEAEADMAGRGLRVLAVALGEGPEEAGLTLLGLVGIADPPRPEAQAAVAAARRAGIETVMITGDHAVTAQAIARELGVLAPGEDPAERVHARVTPEDKLRIVRDWKARGAIVAMTGDGVNDAPAVQEAHVGVAMGLTGTEVTREAAAVVLADDNFASIVEGIREGRAIYDNIRKTVVYLLSGNAAELAVMLGAALVGAPTPLLPIQLLWVNLVTDGLPALALAVDPPVPEVMQRPPRAPTEPILGRAQWHSVALSGLLEAGVVLGLYLWALEDHAPELARTLAFNTLVCSELARSFAARSPTRIFWEVGALTNLKLLLVVALSAALQLSLHLLPEARALFHLTPLPLELAGLALGAGLLPVTLLELGKLGWRALGPSARTQAP